MSWNSCLNSRNKSTYCLENPSPFPIWKWHTAECWDRQLVHSLGFNDNPTVDLPRPYTPVWRDQKQCGSLSHLTLPWASHKQHTILWKLNEETSYQASLVSVNVDIRFGSDSSLERLGIFSRGWDQPPVEIWWLVVVHFLLGFCVAPLQSYLPGESLHLEVLLLVCWS